MASIHDLVAKIADPDLRAKIEAEVNRLSKQKKFGLVFEDHMPECTPLYDVAVRRGSKVAFKNGKVNENYTVLKIANGVATCLTQEGERMEAPVEELVTVAEFGDPIYPYLQPIDTVCNAPDSDLWHTLIEADNYHALQLLEYLYAGKVDCIYIDPPYNTRAKDWKYNNDYVDPSDEFKHSKWLSFMKKRLLLAKKLLNPMDSVLIVTIDEKEYLHLGCLLEELFPSTNIQMVSITINPSGAKRDNLFSRADEYAFIVLFGDAHVMHPKGTGLEQEVRWWYLRRTDYASRRGTVKGGIAQFYPIYVDNATQKIVEIGAPLSPEESMLDIPHIEGATPVFPIRDDGVEMNWGLTGDSLKTLIAEGVVRVTPGNEKQPYVFRYLSANYVDKIREGRWAVRGTREDGTKIVVEVDGKVTRATTVWQSKLYDAGQYGTSLLGDFIGSGRFPFPKSLYAVRDTLKYFVANKPHALIVDFFAGSGTTLHAVNLLNAEDQGQRRCIMVTNNEVAATEATALLERGIQPGDSEWTQLGIARYVTWPRTKNSILGLSPSGAPLDGDYGVLLEEYVLNDEDTVISKDTGKPTRKKIYVKQKVQKLPALAQLQRKDGFQANAAFFKLGFLDKNSVALGRQFHEMLPTLWMKAGAHGPCPAVEGDDVPDVLILPESRFAVLTDEGFFEKFEAAVREKTEIDTIFIVTDYESAFRSMIKSFPGKDAYQLYRDYLDNFRINTGRN